MKTLYVAFVLRYTNKETDPWLIVVVAGALAGAAAVSLGVVAVALAVCGSVTGCR